MVNPVSPSRMGYEMHSLIVGDFGLVMTSLVTIVDLSDLFAVCCSTEADITLGAHLHLFNEFSSLK